MFIQLIQGKVRDEDGLRKCMDRWQADLEPGAEGYLGTTFGVCDDATFIALARFTSAEAAMRNSQRPEQGTWWAETEKCFDGPVTFLDCPQVSEWLDGGSDDAKFVQVMEGHSSDRTRMREVMDQVGDRIHQMRPEIIGATISDFGDDGFVEAVYFRSEAEAREHEKMPMPEDMQSMMAREMDLMTDISYFDLHKPMLVSAASH
jgi:hypothetical protein